MKRFLAGILLLYFFNHTVFGQFVIPQSGLQLWLKAESVESQTDYFLPTMPNSAGNRYSANQPQIKYRPLFLRNFIQNRPAVSLADGRGFNFGVLRVKPDTIVYLGYYYEQPGEEAEFKVETFNHKDISNKTEKNGFVLGIYENMPVFHGTPGYSCAFAELIVYDKKPDEQQDIQIRAHLRGKYSLTDDLMYLRNNPVILGTNVLAVSNVVAISNRTILTAALVESVDKRIPQTTLEIVRSYNSGQKWSQSLGQVLDDKEVSKDLIPFLYITPNDRIYCFYSTNRTTEDYKLAYKYSDDEGYIWSDEVLVEQVSSTSRIEITASIKTAEKTLFALSGESDLPLLFESDIDTALEPVEIDWKILPYIGELIDGERLAVRGSFRVATFEGNILGFFNSFDGYIYQILSKNGIDWSEPKKVLTKDNVPMQTVAEIASMPIVDKQGGLYLIFRNFKAARSKYNDTMWLSKLLDKNDLSAWSAPEVCLYSREFAEDAYIHTRSFDIINDQLYITALLSNGAYFAQLKPSDIFSVIPKGAGVFELNDSTEQKEYYDIQALPSLTDDGFIIDIQFKAEILENNSLIAKIGKNNGRVVLFTQDRQIGLFITDGNYSTNILSCKFIEKDNGRVIFDVNGKTDIIRLVAEPIHSECENVNWQYFPAELGVINDDKKLFVPKDSYANIDSMRLHYKGNLY